MPEAPQDRMNAQEFAQRRWRSHRDVFRVGAFDPGNGATGFMAVDRSQAPPAFVLLMATPDGIRSLRGDLRDDAEAKASLQLLANDILGGNIHSRPMLLDETLRVFGLGAAGAGQLAQLSVERYFTGLADPRITARLPRASLESSETKRFDQSGLGAIRAQLKPEALAAVGAVAGVRWRDYGFYAADGRVGEVRRAAAAAFPLFAAYMVDRISIRRAIDAQVADLERMAEFLRSPEYEAKLDAPQDRGGVSKTQREWMLADGRDPYAAPQLSEKVVRQMLQASFGMRENPGQPDKAEPVVPMHVLTNLRGVSWPTGGLPVDQVVAVLAELPPDWFPKRREDWDAFCDLTATVGRILPGLTGTPLRTLYEGCSGRWEELRLRIVTAYADTRPPEGTSEEDAALLESGIDWEALAKIPRDKLEAAVLASVERLDGLTGNINRDDLAPWVMRRIAPDTSREFLHNACFEILEMRDVFASKVLLPLAANEARERAGRQQFPLAQQHHVVAQRVAANILLPGKSVVRLMEMTRAFANRAVEIGTAGADPATERTEEQERKAREAAQAAVEAATMAVVGIIPEAPIPADGWAPLAPVARAPNGVYVVPLTDPSQLLDEGRGYSGDRSRNRDGSAGLAICVGVNGYAKYCQRDGQHIVSFRVEGGTQGAGFTRLSCMQVGPIKQGSTELKCLQHRGQANGAVPERAARAWEWYQEQIHTGQLMLNYEGVRSRLASARAAQVDEVAQACGYDWRDRKRILEAMNPWGPFVGKKHRKMGVDQFAADPEINTIIQAIDPQLDHGLSARRP